MEINIKYFPNRLGNRERIKYQTTGSAGVDLCFAPEQGWTRGLLSKELFGSRDKNFVKVPTGVAVELPIGFEAQIRSRSGLSAKHGIYVLNAPGTIDSDYRGEIFVMLAVSGNKNNLLKVLEPGARIAQMVISEYEQVQFMEVDELGDTDRGAGGFGSTGV